MAGFTPTLLHLKDHQHCPCSTQSQSQAVAFSVPPTWTRCSEPQTQNQHLFFPQSCYQIFICSHKQSRAEEGGCEEGVSDSFSFLSETAAGNATKKTPQHKSHLLPVPPHTRWGNSWVTTAYPSPWRGSDAVNPGPHVKVAGLAARECRVLQHSLPHQSGKIFPVLGLLLQRRSEGRISASCQFLLNAAGASSCLRGLGSEECRRASASQNYTSPGVMAKDKEKA